MCATSSAAWTWILPTTIVSEIDQAGANSAGEVYLDGLTNVMSEPEFTGSEDARRALRMLEERSLLQNLLARAVLSGNAASQLPNSGIIANPINSVQVLIGGEGTWEELKNFSVVLSRYGTPGLATGTLGVLGPMRLPYGRTISTMRFLSRLLSDLVTETMVEEPDGNSRNAG